MHTPTFNQPLQLRTAYEFAAQRDGDLYLWVAARNFKIGEDAIGFRDDNGYWNQIEAYISSHSAAEFSHSSCPACARKLYGIDL